MNQIDAGRRDLCGPEVSLAICEVARRVALAYVGGAWFVLRISSVRIIAVCEVEGRKEVRRM